MVQCFPQVTLAFDLFQCGKSGSRETPEPRGKLYTILHALLCPRMLCSMRGTQITLPRGSALAVGQVCASYNDGLFVHACQDWV